MSFNNGQYKPLEYAVRAIEENMEVGTGLPFLVHTQFEVHTPELTTLYIKAGRGRTHNCMCVPLANSSVHLREATFRNVKVRAIVTIRPIS